MTGSNRPIRAHRTLGTGILQEVPYYTHCTRDVAAIDYGIDELPGLREGRRADLEVAGIDDIRDNRLCTWLRWHTMLPPMSTIPGTPNATCAFHRSHGHKRSAIFPPTDLQGIVRDAVVDGRAQTHDDIAGALSQLVSPVRYLDCETFAPAIPRFSGTRPYDPIPFLFSVHGGTGNGLRHTDYLHEGSDNLRPALARKLIQALGCKGSICAYSSYKRRVLSDLGAALPKLAKSFAAIERRLVDLLPIVRRNYYHPDFHGSFSIKRVLSAVAPGAGYDDLEIIDGQQSAIGYQSALNCDDPDERRRIFADLRAYCVRDTLAMVKLRNVLDAIPWGA